MDHPFRSAAVGGFNKQDVLTFLEEQSRQFSQAQQRFQEQLDGANQQIETLRRREEELSCQLEEAQRELETARQGRESQAAQAEKADAELSASQAREEQTAKELERARRERDRVQAELDQILPDAQAYAQIKERTAGVELDAHRRAQAIQEKAERDAQRVRRQLEQWLRRMEAEYDRMRGEVAVSHAASELDRVRAGLNRITQLVDDQEGILEGISKAYGETAGPKLEAPMPIPEEE